MDTPLGRGVSLCRVHSVTPQLECFLLLGSTVLHTRGQSCEIDRSVERLGSR